MNWRDLHVWKKAHALTVEVYRLSKKFPHEEKFGLISQIQRAASSIPINIVEGHSRKTSKEFLQFLNIARGSLEELRYLFILCHDIGYINSADKDGLEELACEISRMLDALIKTLQRGRKSR